MDGRCNRPPKCADFDTENLLTNRIAFAFGTRWRLAPAAAAAVVCKSPLVHRSRHPPCRAPACASTSSAPCAAATDGRALSSRGRNRWLEAMAEASSSIKVTDRETGCLSPQRLGSIQSSEPPQSTHSRLTRDDRESPPSVFARCVRQVCRLRLRSQTNALRGHSDATAACVDDPPGHHGLRR